MITLLTIITIIGAALIGFAMAIITRLDKLQRDVETNQIMLEELNKDLYHHIIKPKKQ